MATETSNVQNLSSKQDALNASVKKRMKQLEDPVSSTFNHKDILKSMSKAGDVSFNNPLRFIDDAVRPPSKGSPRFGTLSHHSFFSRHNPHPHRVTHIQATNLETKQIEGPRGFPSALTFHWKAEEGLCWSNSRMATETSNVQNLSSKQDALNASVKKRMKQLEDPVSSTFNHKDILKSMSKAGDVSFNNPLRFIDDAVRPPSKGSPRFGTLSHHSFFSRHNPHPHRVTHIQGLNGNPVCIVNDNWYASTPLCPHPLIRSQLPMTVLGAPGLQWPFGELYGSGTQRQGTGLLSEAWREELKDLAAKICLAGTFEKEEKKVEVPVRRVTQYSAQTGRIIPPSSRAASHRSNQASRRHARTKGQFPSAAICNQELMVLELLCQILQTDSLSQVQQWLLSAGQREKDMVMGMIQTAVANSSSDHQQIGENPEGFVTQMSPLAHSSSCPSTTGHNINKNLLNRFYHEQKPKTIKEEEMPERIGTAEVLQIHTDPSLDSQENENSNSGNSKDNLIQ